MRADRQLPPPTVLVRDARKRFARVDALDGVSLELRPGEWVGLVGPNGAGKTTLLRALAGLERLDRGTVEIAGRPVHLRMRRNERDVIGYVPQELALYPLLTARENLEAFGQFHGLAAGELSRSVARALDWTGLAERADERVQTFSGGMRRRLNIACGVLHRPAAVLLDEPTVGVDPPARWRIREMLAELRAGGTALLQSSHQLDELQSICDRILVVDHGRVVAAGSVDDLTSVVAAAPRDVVVRLDRPARGDELGSGLQFDGSTVRARLRDLDAELPGLLARIAAARYRIVDVHSEAPGLEAVYTHLIGAGLRE